MKGEGGGGGDDAPAGIKDLGEERWSKLRKQRKKQKMKKEKGLRDSRKKG